MEEYKRLSEENGKLISITICDFLLGLRTDLYVNTLTVYWFNRMKQD